MPTKLGTKTVRREVVTASAGSVVLELTPGGLRVRGKRKRVAPTIPYDVLAARVADLLAADENVDPSRDVETRFYQLHATLTPDGVMYREHGTRKDFLIPHGVAFQRAVGLAISAEKAEKRKNKPSRRRRTKTTAID